jgi:Uma2 family endonuclease
MATIPATLAPKPAETRIVLDNVTWAAFEALLAAEGPDRGRMAYEEGTLEIMSPSSEHEKLKSRISRLLSIYTEEVGIDVEAMGSTTLKRSPASLPERRPG